MRNKKRKLGQSGGAPKEARTVLLAKKIDKLKDKIEKNKQLSDQRYRALQDFVRLLTNFASHDIKNAIHNMDGLLSTLNVETISSSQIDTLKSCLDNIRNSLNEFNLMSNDVEKDEFKLRELFAALDSLHRPLLRREKVKFSIEYKGVPKDILVKQVFHSILQVFNNLLINAFEFLDGADKREIYVEITSIDQDKLQIRICDTGIGIKQEDRLRIFDPYFTTKDSGSGVGLAHVKYMLESINGTVQLENSDPNSYYSTIFKVELPLI